MMKFNREQLRDARGRLAHRARLAIVRAVLCLAPALCITATAKDEVMPTPEPQVAPAPRALVGVNYFAGWWPDTPNKWQRHADSKSTEAGADWRPDFPGRVPLLGEYNSQETMDRELPAAAEHGVDFFPMLWYYNGPEGGEREPHSGKLNDAIKYFMDSPHAAGASARSAGASAPVRFFIEFCNHPPYQVSGAEEWQQCIQTWLGIMKHPGYLRVGGRLVFKVHGGHYFLKQNDGDAAQGRAQLEQLREAARGAGLGEMIIGCGVGALEPITGAHPLTKLFDFTCTYMDIPPLKQRAEDYPYEMVADLARAARQVHCHDAIPYMPYLTAGWSPRPWPDERAYFAFPTREQWGRELTRMKDDLAGLPNLGLPLPGGAVQPAFTTYAWNEFGEGGIVAPTQGDGTMKLEEIRRVFGASAPEPGR